MIPTRFYIVCTSLDELVLTIAALEKLGYKKIGGPYMSVFNHDNQFVQTMVRIT